MKKKSRRKKAIIRYRIFIAICITLIIVVLVLIGFGVKSLFSKNGGNNSSGNQNSSEKTTSSISEDVDSSTSSTIDSTTSSTSETGPNGLDVNYKNLLIVNADNPLPKDYDYEGHLTTIPDNYINGSLKQIDKNVWPYMKAMIDAAWADNVKLYVWSPYRSYSTQNMLFQKQVDRCINDGTPKEKAEDKAATVVARPGTSEHNSGLAADFNMASDKFETTPMFNWMKLHAQDYGFIMRYSGEKQNITGVIHESWHYRFVGIKAAKEMNRLGMCLEEYVEYIK